MADTKFARKCSCCGNGMNDGVVIGDGLRYACSTKCLYVDGYTPAQFDADYEADWAFWTEWDVDEDDDADGYYTADGKRMLYAYSRAPIPR